MTGTTLLAGATALFNDNTPTDYSAQALPLLNILMAETFDVNNRLRKAAGKALLTQIPEMAALSETVPFEEMLVRRAFAYGQIGRAHV